MFKYLTYTATVAAAFWAAPAPATTLALNPAETVVFTGVVDDDSVATALARFAEITQQSDEVTLVIDSPGGYVDSGLKFVTEMAIYQSQGVTFRCFVTGMAASMAFGILAECDSRFTMPFAGLLWHPIRTSVRGAITTESAKELSQMLEYYEAPFRARIQASLGVDDEYFYLHWYRETMHPGRTLVQDNPTWIVEVSGATGMPVQSLFWTPPPRGIFGEVTYDPPTRIIWVAPGYESSAPGY